MNKQNLKTLALSPSKQNLFLALSIGEGLGMVEEVLEWWWDKNWYSYEDEQEWFISTDLLSVSIDGQTYGMWLIEGQYEDFMDYKTNLPPLPTIIQNIKDYTFALILHLWEFGEEEVE